MKTMQIYKKKGLTGFYVRKRAENEKLEMLNNQWEAQKMQLTSKGLFPKEE